MTLFVFDFTDKSPEEVHLPQLVSWAISASTILFCLQEHLLRRMAGWPGKAPIKP